ncbi:HNH endonuclease [Curtobacterium sp. MCBD17_030]|uniref:HNH endonuclease n=1 Tax=Curtobacterium sp. MCBD17_030 TaxID=2175649 RepID=UPI000D88D33E|nr:HNH endonuclease signature motif containing protein [Curtobacterium sp. MCBD17_030]PYY32364.1 HNH endonuclease [Curtobacterium sp. MCBD17_030]
MSSHHRNTKQRDADRARIRNTAAACHICGQAIDYTLPHTNPRSFVVDHVIPLAKDGPDTIDNKAAAHRDCNSTKRARLIAPIVCRSGSLQR